MIASPHTCLFCGQENQHNSWAVRRCHYCKRKQGNNWLQKLSEDLPDTLPPPLLLCYELLNSWWGWLYLWLIKDLAGEAAVVPLTFEAARYGSDCTKTLSGLGIRGGRKLTNDFSGFASWQRWQAVNRENAISFVVNYQPTQSDTRQRKSSRSDSSFSCHAEHTSAKTTAHTLRHVPHFYPHVPTKQNTHTTTVRSILHKHQKSW